MVIIRLKCTETKLLVISGWFGNKNVFDPYFISLFLYFHLRLPIPKLEDTIRRYLVAQRFLLDDKLFRWVFTMEFHHY